MAATDGLSRLYSLYDNTGSKTWKIKRKGRRGRLRGPTSGRALTVSSSWSSGRPTWALNWRGAWSWLLVLLNVYYTLCVIWCRNVPMTTKGYSHHSCKVTLAVNKYIFPCLCYECKPQNEKRMKRFPILIETLFSLVLTLLHHKPWQEHIS